MVLIYGGIVDTTYTKGRFSGTFFRIICQFEYALIHSTIAHTSIPS